MSGYGILFSFGVDNGELDGIPPHHVFVLGFELGMIYRAIEEEREYNGIAHAENLPRIQSMCEKLGFNVASWWFHGDPSEQWVDLKIRERKT